MKWTYSMRWKWSWRTARRSSQTGVRQGASWQKLNGLRLARTLFLTIIDTVRPRPVPSSVTAGRMVDKPKRGGGVATDSHRSTFRRTPVLCPAKRFHLVRQRTDSTLGALDSWVRLPGIFVVRLGRILQHSTCPQRGGIER